MNRAIQIIEQKLKADAPVAFYDDKPITKGKGRFGPYIKWNDMFINVPRAYNYDALTQKDMDELIEKKIAKEANRYIQNWPDEKISIENARWGPVIKFGKKILRIPKKTADIKYTVDELAALSIEDVKKMIEAELPNAFGKKAAKSEKKTTAKKKINTKKAVERPKAKKKSKK